MRLKDKLVIGLLAVFFVATPTGVFLLSWKWGAVILGLCALLVAVTLASADD